MEADHFDRDEPDQWWPVSKATKSSSDNPIARMLWLRIERELATQGKIKISNSGINFSGHSNPASPKIRHIWTMKHNPRLFTFAIIGDFFLLNTRFRVGGSYRSHIGARLVTAVDRVAIGSLAFLQPTDWSVFSLH